MGHQLAATYRLTGPSGDVAVFNDSADSDYIGVLTDLAGLDGAPIRESGENLPEADGGVHGSFYRGRRPITLEGIIVASDTPAARNAKIDKLLRAADALRADATLRWTEDGTPERALWLRQNAEPKISGGPGPKRFQLGLVSADAYVRAWAESTVFDEAAPLDIPAASIVNLGNALAWPVLKLTGAATGAITIKNETTGATLQFKSGFSITAGQYVTIDTRPGIRSALRDNGSNYYGLIDFAQSTWPSITAIAAGNRFTASGGTRLDVTWRHAWIG